MNINQQKNQHLWWRTGFGPPADQAEILAKHSPKELFSSILKASEKKPEFFDVASPEIKELVDRQMDLGKMNHLHLEPRQIFRKHSIQDISKLNMRWLQEMTDSSAQLREKMALFWHGHFASKTGNIIFDQIMLNTIREHSLGNFKYLLFQVSKSGAMIQFLNNNQNKKDYPNENFARELMELFTIGRGYYSEADVKEAARAFTGWGTNMNGEFNFRGRQHDGSVKTFFGKTGNFSGEDILEILLEQKQTARFITKKIYRFFVNEMVEEHRLDILSSRFYQSGYDIRDLLIGIFNSEWFFDQKNIGSQIKSPIVWMVGIRRQLPMEIQNAEVQLILEHLLGQVLFSPPNVAGWPGGKHWIDSSSLMLRMKIPKIIYQAEMIMSQPKDDDDMMMGMQKQPLEKYLKKIRNPVLQLFQAKIFWKMYTENFDQVADSELYEAISDSLLQKTLPMSEDSLDKYIDMSNRQSLIQSLTIRLMGTPEYQLC